MTASKHLLIGVIISKVMANTVNTIYSWIVVIVLLVVAYGFYYKYSERKSLNDANIACLEIARNQRERNICQDSYDKAVK